MSIGAIVKTEDGVFRDIVHGIDLARCLEKLWHNWHASYVEVEYDYWILNNH